MTFKSNYSLSVESAIRGDHVYKETWNPYKGEKLMCNYEKRGEAKIFEDHAVGTYKDSRLVDHVPIKLSFLFCKFIEKRNNQIFAEVNGGRKLGNGLVVLCIYHVNGNKKHIETCSEEISKLKKGKAIHMKIKISEIRRGTFLLVYFFGSIFVYICKYI